MEVLQAVSADELLCAALDIGEHILKNGGEIHRVEDTVERIGYAFGAKHVEVFTITSLIIASVRMADGTTCQQMRRIIRTMNNMQMLERLNDLSRHLCAGEVPIAEVHARITEMKHRRPYPAWLFYLGAVLVGGASAVFFGGTWRDAVCAGAATLCVALCDRHAPARVNPMIVTLISSFIGGVVGLLLIRLGIGENTDPMVSGTIMILIPGLSLGNSFRDMLSGDMLSGMMRMFQSLMIALMIALGFAAAMLLLRV